MLIKLGHTVSGPTWSAGVAGPQGVALVARLAPVAVAAGVAGRAHTGHGAVRVEVALAAEPGEQLEGNKKNTTYNAGTHWFPGVVSGQGQIWHRAPSR